MNQGKTVFRQLTEAISRYEFEKCAKKYNGNYRVRHFNAWQHFLCMMFGQLTHRESLRDIVTCLQAQGRGLYHLGFGKHIARSTLSDANKRRDWRIYRDFAHYLMGQATDLYAADPIIMEVDNPVYALDSSLIRLCVEVFGWAKYRKTTAGVKMHVALDVHTAIPHFFYLSEGRSADIGGLRKLPIEPAAYYVMDRGYWDLRSLHRIENAKAFFVIRAKTTLKFKRSRSISRAEAIQHTIKADQIGIFSVPSSYKQYPKPIRRIRAKDAQTGLSVTLVTNNLTLPAQTIAEMYRKRWKVELFFKWVKQHLRIKTFWGYSENAVKIQLFTALSTYFLIAIARKNLNIHTEMNNILQILSVNIFVKTPVNQLLTQTSSQETAEDDHNQLSIW